MTHLVSMRPESFPAFFEAAVASYARDNVASGRWLDHAAPALSEEETSRLLPRGVNTPDHQLFEIRNEPDDCVVGFLWLATLHRGTFRVAYVYQVIVLAEHRRHGHGRAALQQAAAIAASQGHASMELHVFAHNNGAQALYEALGFRVTGLNMMLPLHAEVRADRPTGTGPSDEVIA